MSKSIYLVILTILILVSNLPADTYYVDDCNGNDDWTGTSPIYIGDHIGPFRTIAEGIDRVHDGDTVIVADGTYYSEENLQLNFYDDLVTLKSANGPENCILNFYGNDYGWRFYNNAENLINGFTIRGVTAGIIKGYFENKVEFYNCIFENNALENNNSLITCQGQGALKLNKCLFRNNIVGQSNILEVGESVSLEISNCSFTENISIEDYSIISCMGDCNAVIINTQVDENWNYNGRRIWAIHCGERANVKIADCSITNNSSDYYASAIVCENEANVLISGCDISSNSSKKENYAVYIMSDYTVNIKIENCIISDNNIDFSYDSCGIYVEDCNLLEVTNCLILSHFRSGIESDSCLAHTNIKNCTIVNNTDDFYGTGIMGNEFTTVENCIIKGFDRPLDGIDVVVSYSDISDNTDHIWPGIGNINANPLFADPNNGDYHLLSEAGRYNPTDQQWVRDDFTSPCIDAGNPADWIDDEPACNGGRINMGYFGGSAQASKTDSCTSVAPGDINRDCFVNFIDFALMTSDWLTSTVEP